MESSSNWEKVKCKLENTTLLSSADTGGHAEFLDMHPALINGPSFNLLYWRLNDELDSLFKVHFTDEEGESTQKEDSDSTVEEVLFQSLSSITCCGSSEGVGVSSTINDLESKVMVVGTHRDLVSDEEFRVKDEALRQKIEKSGYKNVLPADGQKQFMLSVDNMSGDQAEVEKIRTTLRNKLSEFKRIPIPARWFVLSLLIRNHKNPTMSLTEFKVLAASLQIDPEEVPTALWFLHRHLGVLLYYPEVEHRQWEGPKVEDTVFCKIQAVLLISSRWCMLMQIQAIWRDFEMRGNSHWKTFKRVSKNRVQSNKLYCSSFSST